MAEYKFTAALNAATFPLVTRFQPRSIIIAGMDNRLRDANSGTRNTDDNDNNPQNLPQVVYCENVMPTDQGVVSVGFDPVQAQVPSETQFDDVFILRDETENTWYFSPARGENYVTSAFGVAWASTDPLGGASNEEVSIAYVNGVTWVLYAHTVLLRWDGVAESFVDESANLQGVTISEIVAICGSGNYLVLFCDDLSYKWSSLVDPLDFVPSDQTGAGSQIPVDVRGGPVTIRSVAGGVIIFCRQNAVAAIATNNSSAPWTFREIKNAGGISSTRDVSVDNNSGATYIWGTNGFQEVRLREAENMFPSLTDFLAGRVLEEFNSSTNLLTVTRLSSNLFVKVAYIAGRYIVASYGTASGIYTYALIYDIGLRRWGKLKREHVDVFSSYGGARQSICLLSETGAVNQAVIDWRSFSDAGVLILGRYQLGRTYQICSQEVELEVLDGTESVSVQVCTNYNGTTVGQILPMLAYENTSNYRKFQRQIEGENLTYILKGTFSLATMLITATRGARF